MYLGFDENKYPSTNIKIKDFKSHINLIRNSNIQFISPRNLKILILNLILIEKF